MTTDPGDPLPPLRCPHCSMLTPQITQLGVLEIGTGFLTPLRHSGGCRRAKAEAEAARLSSPDGFDPVTWRELI